MRQRVMLVASAALLLGGAHLTRAEEATPAASPTQESTPLTDEDKRVLTPEEKAEKEARKVCKIKLCAIFASKDNAGDDVSCDIVKTWREEDIAKMLGGKVTWPWGKAVCQSKLELARAPLVKAMSEPAYEIVMSSHKVRCTLAQKDNSEPYVVEVAMAPKVKFKDGKAADASINWGEATAPMLIYPLIYAGTGLDNSTNFLGPEVVVRMVNEFTTKKCAEVKDELPPH